MTIFCRRGSRGPVVVDCQNALNANLRPSPRLTPDGDFGPATDTAVRAFQRQEALVSDGLVGNNTYAALMVSVEAYPPIMHNLSLIAQPSHVTCWAAATAWPCARSCAMISHRTVPQRATWVSAMSQSLRTAFGRPMRCFNAAFAV